MLNKSRYQYLTGQRQYDIPGASLRGPYKRWIPQTDNRHSESETEAPKAPTSSTHRTHAQHSSSSHAAAGNTAYATTSSSNSRNQHPSSSHHAAPAPSPAPQKQRTERAPYGYSSESTVHAPVQASKPSSSSFGLFKSHPKESRGHSSSTSKREELPRSTTAPAAVPSRYQASQPVPVPTSAKSSSRNVPAPTPTAVFGSLSTQTSTDPSPRSSTDSGPRSGHVSAPAAGYSDTRKQSHAIWNPYVDARLNAPSTSRKNDSGSSSLRRDDKKAKDKEDMVARVTEALGGGSTGKAKAAESALLQSQSQTARRDDSSSTRRTTASTGTRPPEAQSHIQAQPTPTLRRHKTTPQATPLMVNGHLPDNSSKSSRPSTTSSRGHPEMSSRMQSPPEPPAKVSSSSKIPTSSSSKLPHSRTASSPWPFNQALPPEQVIPISKPPPPQTHSTSWKPFARFHGSSTSTSKPSDPRPPPTDTPQYSSHTSPLDGGRSSHTTHTPSPVPHQQPHASNNKSSLPRGSATSYSYPVTTPAPSRDAPPPTPAHAPLSTTAHASRPTVAHATAAQNQTQPRPNPSYATTSTEQPQRWSPNTPGPGKSDPVPTGTQQPTSTSQSPWPTTSRYQETVLSPGSEPTPAPPPTNGGRYTVNDTQSAVANIVAPTASGRSVPSSTVGLSTSQAHRPTTSRYPEPNNALPSASESEPEPGPERTTRGRYAVSGVQSATANTSSQVTPGKSASAPTEIQPSTSQTQWPTPSRYPETGSTVSMAPQSISGGRYANGAQPASTVTPGQTTPNKSVPAPSGAQLPQATSQSLWPTNSRYPDMGSAVSLTTQSASGGRYVDGTQSAAINPPSDAAPNRPVTASTGVQQPQTASQALWSTGSRYPEATSTVPVATESVPANTGQNAVNSTLSAATPDAGAWASKPSSTNLPSSDYETLTPLKESTNALALQTSSGTSSHASTPPEPEAPGRYMANGTSIPEKQVAGAWTSKHANGNLSASTFEVFSTPKPSPRPPVIEASTSATSKYASTTSLAPESASRGLRYQTPTSTPLNQPATSAPGAWTTSSRYATNTSGSIFDTTPSAKSQGTTPNLRETSTGIRQATLGTAPVAGAWTTKNSPVNATPASSESTLKQSPTNNNTPSNSSLLKPQPASGTTTGTSTPSSAQMTDLIAQLSPVTSHSISTRVPISGHPSTPAPVRPVLRATPPPLSISSTSPDTDSLLTPSSLNSPRSTIMLPQSQPVATITTATAPQPPEKENAPRKNGFFDFFRPKPPLKYEVWTPPTRSSGEKDRKREEPLKEPAPPPKPKPSSSVPVPPRPRSPKIGRNPFKLFSRRHRTVSTASLDVLDGTAANTLMNSPASSMRADTPGAPPSPPLRDAILATQEWRNREATDLVVSGRKRRHRPGVTFDCPEDVAPIDILPSRLRIGRPSEDDDDY